MKNQYKICRITSKAFMKCIRSGLLFYRVSSVHCKLHIALIRWYKFDLVVYLCHLGEIRLYKSNIQLLICFTLR